MDPTLKTYIVQQLQEKEHVNNNLTKHSFVILFDNKSVDKENINRKSMYHLFESAKKEGLVVESKLCDRRTFKKVLDKNTKYHIYYLTNKGADEVYIYFL